MSLAPDICFGEVDVVVAGPEIAVEVAASAPPQVALTAAAVVVVVETGVQGGTGAAGRDGQDGASGGALVFTAGSAVSGHRALMFDPVGSGDVMHADTTAPAYTFAGLSLGAAAAGAPVEATVNGLVEESSWSWTPLAPVFVAPGGALSQSQPVIGLRHCIGFAPTSTSLLVLPATPVALA